jgi:hypothetical protein
MGRAVVPIGSIVRGVGYFEKGVKLRKKSAWRGSARARTRAERVTLLADIHFFDFTFPTHGQRGAHRGEDNRPSARVW